MATADARVRFLSQSSRLLSISSQSVSANLSTTIKDWADEDTVHKEASLLSRCKACGSQDTTTRTSAVNSMKIKSSVASRRASLDGTTLVRLCQRCRRSIKLRPGSKRSGHDRREKRDRESNTADQRPQSQAVSNEGTRISGTETSADTPRNSKKRAKIRKDKSGLQALLDQSKQTTAASKGLNLMDFMA